MKPFRTFVSEVFETGDKWRSYWRGPEKEFAFDVPAYGIRFNYDGGVYMVHIIANNDPDDTSIWTVDFGLFSGPKGVGLNDPYSVTGTGNSIPVFSIVLDILMAFIQKKSPKHVMFSAKEQNRANLYKRMISTLIPKFGLNYKLSSEYKVDDGTTDFILTRVDPEPDELNEVFNTKVEWDRDLIQKTEKESLPYGYNPILIPIEIDGTKFIMNFEFRDGDDWVFSFGRITDETDGLGDDSLFNDKKFQFKVFSVVIDVVQEFIKRIKPKVFEFAARKSEESRVKLYDRLASVIGGKNPNYTFTSLNIGSVRYYTFTQKAMTRYLDESADLNESKINWSDINVYGYIKPNGKMIVKGADSRGKFNHYRIAKNLGYSDHRDPIFKNGWIRFDHYHGWDKLPSGVHDYAGYEFFNDDNSKLIVFNHIKKTTDNLDKIVFDIHQTKQSEYPYDIRSFEFDSKPKALLFLMNSRSSLDESTEIVVESENMNSFAQFIKNHSM